MAATIRASMIAPETGPSSMPNTKAGPVTLVEVAPGPEKNPARIDVTVVKAIVATASHTATRHRRDTTRPSGKTSGSRISRKGNPADHPKVVRNSMGSRGHEGRSLAEVTRSE